VRSAPLTYDVAGGMLWEHEARQERIGLEIELVGSPPRPRYRFVVDTPGHDDERLVTVSLPRADSHENPIVHIDGPKCLRHRWQDRSLCMWDPLGPPSERWMAGDGFRHLVGHIRFHAFCEAECRLGEAWPKEEMPGQHPRPRHCPSCRGKGR
jgi:hypothetical protein